MVARGEDHEDVGPLDVPMPGSEESTRRGTLMRTTEGEIAFPRFIPPVVRSPEPPGPPGDNGLLSPERAQRPRQTSEPMLVAPRPAQLSQAKSNIDHGSSREWRPDDAARSKERRGSLLRPLMNRSGASSYLNRAIWEGVEQYRESSSSESDEEPNLARRETSPANERDGRPAKGLTRLLTIENSDDKYRRFSVGNPNYLTSGKVKKDGRLAITVNETANTGYLAKALGAALHKAAAPKTEAGEAIPEIKEPTSPQLSLASTEASDKPRLRLNIVIMVIGSRGDAQPFLKIGKVLKEEYGHRVRIATHPSFREFVERDSGLEFFSVGGDPSELMAFMVKNPGLIPTIETVKAGDIGKRRAAMAEMFDGFWRACINATDDEKDTQNLKMMGAKDPFVADAIIANPPSFAHIHCAEALGIPLHLMFTFPYTPTQAFPHPLASIKKSNVDPQYTNFISYPLVEMMVWQGLGDLVNHFRVKTLSLDPVSTLWAPGATYRLHVPFTYLWSPSLVPKPPDWGSEIDIAGFVFLDLASSFKPPKELEDFLAAGEAPIYIGFGSIVVDDADRFTQMIFKAVELAGVRALVSKGWGGFGAKHVPENIFMLENTPHDWLFPKVKACVIHGGAGTTAIALKCGLPTMVVPFFGDQYFWGKMIQNADVGPEPVPYKNLTAEKLAEGIEYLLTDKARKAAAVIAKDIDLEGNGAENAVEAFHRQMRIRGPATMRCSILQDQVAVWQLKGTSVRLSPLAADVLVGHGLVGWKHLRLIRHKEWNDFSGPGEPVTGVAGSIAGTIGQAFKGIVGVPYNLAKRSKLRREKNKKRQEKKAQRDRVDPDAPTDGLVAFDAASIQTETTAGGRAEQCVENVRSGVRATTMAITRAPVDLSLALAQGFHNAPRLYGDNTVRRPPRVTGFRSGLRAARAEFVYGIYDGFTGVVRLPVRGAKERGVVGFVKGTGMGLTGFVLKNLAAIIGPVGYTLKGLVKQTERSKTPQQTIRRARIVQGQRDAREVPEDDRNALSKEIIDGWHILKGLCEKITEIEKQRGLAGHIEGILLDRGFLFKDVEVARRALEALNKGEQLERVLCSDREGRERSKCERRSQILQRSLNLTRKSMDEPRASSTGRREAFTGEVDDAGEKKNNQYLQKDGRLAVPVA